MSDIFETDDETSGNNIDLIISESDEIIEDSDEENIRERNGERNSLNSSNILEETQSTDDNDEEIEDNDDNSFTKNIFHRKTKTTIPDIDLTNEEEDHSNVATIDSTDKYLATEKSFQGDKNQSTIGDIVSTDEGEDHSIENSNSSNKNSFQKKKSKSTNFRNIDSTDEEDNSVENSNSSAKSSSHRKNQSANIANINSTDEEMVPTYTPNFINKDINLTNSSFRVMQQRQLTDDSESEDEDLNYIRKQKLTTNSLRTKRDFNNITDDSEDEDLSHTRKQETLKTKQDSNNITDDDDTPINTFKKDSLKLGKGRKPMQIVDSDSESDDTPAKEKSHMESPKLTILKKSHHNTGNIESAAPQLQIRKDLFDTSLNNSLSEGFKQRPSLLSSTLIPQDNTPRNPNSGKRLFNRNETTPRLIKQSKDASVVAISSEDSEDIIEVSDEEIVSVKTPAVKKQTTMLDFVKKDNGDRKGETAMESQDKTEVVFAKSSIKVSSEEYLAQRRKVQSLQGELDKIRTVMEKVNMKYLPDKGLSLKHRLKFLEDSVKTETQKFFNMTLIKKAPQDSPAIATWEEIEAGTNNVQPKTFGKQAMSKYNAEKALTIDKLQALHSSLKTCPKDSDLSEPPKGLKVELMNHQLRALSWLMWRETQNPSGGILADDMGLGKTLTMISLMLKSLEIEKSSGDDNSDSEDEETNKRHKYEGGTLVICPASLLDQWENELQQRTKRGLASCELFHGPKRESKPKRLAEYNMVITTYSIVNKECAKDGALFKIKWRRIVVDEAHQMRNHKSQTSEAICRLKAKSRWALTGTPVHNKELDMYALLKFLRCKPFDELATWKRWIGDKNAGGTERLHTIISSLLLRRTKAELIEKKMLNTMPTREWKLIPVVLAEEERKVYSQILLFSRTLFAEFLHQRAEKNQEMANWNVGRGDSQVAKDEYNFMRQKLLRVNRLRDVKHAEILVLILRLRQICCHPSLIIGMLHEDMELLGDDDETAADKEIAMDVLDQINKLTINENQDVSINIANEEASSLRDAVKTVLSPSDPVFSKERPSSKVKAIVKLVKTKISDTEDKAIIVSQWPTFLGLIAKHLKALEIHYEHLDGKVPVNKRMDIVNRMNDPNSNLKILLLSLTAGGVGLNLVGANHLILTDLHWNPQLENQAQDRIYRIGQTKPVYIYKFMASDTIEKRILDLQEKKLGIADSMLTGTVQAGRNKLSLDDLKTLFDM